jgi:hypothetical protein
MEIKRNESQTSRTGPSDCFTGTVRIDPLFTEPFALLVVQPAYQGQAGPELAHRFERFAP